DLARLPITVGPPGQQTVVPLNQIAEITEGVAPAEISHLNRDRVIDVQANVEGKPLSEVVRTINEKAASIAIPPGYVVSQGGEARDTAEVFTAILEALGLAVLLMYLILVVQFGSFIDPIAILVSLPLSLIGVVLMLLLLNTHLNIMSMIGVILLF